MKNEEQKKIREEFEVLLGKDKLNYIQDNNWISFNTKNPDIWKVNQIGIRFLEKDGHQDTVIHHSIYYDRDDKVWISENCIDRPHLTFKTFKEMSDHVADIENDIIGNGFNMIDI